MNYYTGNTIPLGVVATEAGVPFPMTSAAVTVYQPDNTVLISGAASIGGGDNNEARFDVSQGLTKQQGRHRAYFVMQFPGNRERTFEIITNVIINPQKET